MFGIARFLELHCDTQNIEFGMGGCLGMFFGGTARCRIALCMDLQGVLECNVAGIARWLGMEDVLDCKVFWIPWLLRLQSVGAARC